MKAPLHPKPAPALRAESASPDSALEARWQAYLERLHACRLCPTVHSHPVVGAVPGARIYLLGQAPGPKEPVLGRPFAWTAGRTLFAWFATLGVTEAQFRQRVYMGAVIRCFPGKAPAKPAGGNTLAGTPRAKTPGDRKPSRQEIAACSAHLAEELALLRPGLVIPVGRLAIEQLIPCPSLDAVVGRCFHVQRHGQGLDVLPLPHPSGLSRWIQSPQGKARIAQALDLLRHHAAWQETFKDTHRPG